MDLKTLMSLGRFKDISMILIKYGFDDLAHRLGIPGIELIKKVPRANHKLGTFERIRYALEDLGPTFVKFGQIMSQRPDLLPPSLIEELSKLQDDVASVEFSEIRAEVEKSTGRPLEETFSIFDVEPLAAASISQVHRAVFKKDGQIASIKVQRPGIRSKMEKDLNLLAAVASELHERVEYLKSHDLPKLVTVVRRTLLYELDFRREVRNMKIARTYAGEDSPIHIPYVYEEYCSERLLAMEYIQGARLKGFKTETLKDPESLAKAGLRAAIKQIFEDGFFHADPHPGNIMITQEEGICLIDWGMTGRLSERDRYELIDLLKSVVDKDGEAMVNALLRISIAEAEIDQRSVERKLLDILDSYYAVPIKDMNIGQLLMAITDVLRTHHLTLPSDLVIMIKALVSAEGTARHIYSELNIVLEAKAQISKLAAKRYKLESIWRHFRFSLSRFVHLQQELPQRVGQILSKAERGQFTLGFRHENLSGLRNTLGNVTNRLSFAIIIAAMIVGSSMIITTGVGPLLFGFPALGVVGYVISGLLGLWLVFNIIRYRNY